MRNIDLVGWLDRPGDSLYLTDKATRRHGGEIDLHRSARRHVANLAFSKICNDVPLARVQQREHGNASARVRARRDVQADDPAGKWSSDFAVGKFERRKVHRGDRAGALRDQRRQSAEGCLGLVQSLFLRSQRRGGDVLCRCRPVHVVRFRKAVGQKRLQSLERVAGLLQFCFRAFHAGFGGLDLKFQLRVLRSRHLDLLVEGPEGRLSFLQSQFVIGGINFEEHIAGSHRLIVLHVELDDLASHARRNADDICPCDGIIGAGMMLDDSPDAEGQYNRSNNRRDADDQANRLAPFTWLRRCC